MADKTTPQNNIRSKERKTENDDGLMKENEREKALLHTFFVSAIQNIYHSENECWEQTDITGRSVSCNEKQRRLKE